MLRITSLSQTKEAAVLKIEGRVAGSDVSLLEWEMKQKLQNASCLVLELEGLKHIDREGLAVLKRWAGEKLILRGGSTFVRTLLATHGLV